MSPRPFELDDLYRLPVVSDAQLSPDGRHVAYVVSTADRDEDTTRSHVWVVGVDERFPRQLTRGGSDHAPRWSPDSKTIAFTSKRDGDDAPQLWLLPTSGGDPRRLTDRALGVGAAVWSPDGTAIAFLGSEGPDRDDHEPVVVDRLGYKADGAGLLAGRHQHLFTVDVATGSSRMLTDGDYHADGPAWSPDGRRIAFSASHRRPGDDLTGASQLLAVPADGGPAQALTADEGTAMRPMFTPEGEHILFVGDSRPRVGHQRLWLVDADGGARRPVAAGFDRNVMVGAPAYPGGTPVLSAEGDAVLFAARDAGCTHLFLSDLDADADPRPVVTGEDRVVDGISPNADRSRIAFVSADPDTCGEVHIAAVDGSGERRLTDHVAESLPDVVFARPEPRAFDAPDGTPVQGWLVGDDSDGPGPLLVDIHGGPHNAWNPALDPAHLYQQALAASGWRVLMLNPRGSDGYGEEFFRATVGGWGRADLADFLTPVQSLVDDGVADEDALTVCGYSYGGYMTNWLTTQTDRFAAAVSGGCVTNLVSFAGTSDAGVHLDRFEIGWQPDRDPSLALDLSPLTHANAVTTPTLILHGEDDERCPVGQAEEWFAALRSRECEVELVRYPGGGHLFVLDGRPSHRIDYAGRLVDWVTSHVKR